MLLPSKTNRNQAEPGTEPDTIMDNSERYWSCVQLIHVSPFKNHSEPG